jgi:hypothetical protein
MILIIGIFIIFILFSLIYQIDASVGSGKTAFAVFHSLYFSQLNPQAKIYSNFNYNEHLFKYFNWKIPNFVYTPYFVLPISEIIKAETALIIIDDMKSAEILNYLMIMIGSMSRKVNLDIIMTAQDYTMFQARLRRISTYSVDLFYNEVSDKLLVKLYRDNQSEPIRFTIRDMRYYVFPYYDTKQVVSTITKPRIVKEILRICKNKQDIDDNIYSIFGSNKTVLKDVRKTIYKKKGYAI